MRRAFGNSDTSHSYINGFTSFFIIQLPILLTSKMANFWVFYIFANYFIVSHAKLLLLYTKGMNINIILVTDYEHFDQKGTNVQTFFDTKMYTV